MSRPSYELAHCIVCGHTDARVIATADDFQREITSLREYHQSRLRPNTPTARLMDRVAFSEPSPLHLVQCRECGLVYRNPIERPRELAEIYENEAPAIETLRALHETQRGAMRSKARAIRAHLGRQGTGLEVGSYVGAFLTAARDEGLRFEGLDVNEDVNRFTRSLGFTAHEGDLVAFAAASTRTFDVIAIWNAFDQVADPRATLHAAHARLAPNGVLALRVPSGAFYARWARATNALQRACARELLAQNNLLTFPYRWGFTPGSLSTLLRATGFEVIRMRGDVLVPTADEWTRRWARIEESIVRRLVALPSRWRTNWAPWFDTYARVI